MEGYVNFKNCPWDIYYELMEILDNSYILSNRNRVNVTGVSHINYRKSAITNDKQKNTKKLVLLSNHKILVLLKFGMNLGIKDI